MLLALHSLILSRRTRLITAVERWLVRRIEG
jgi:hypothetical protein